MAQMSKFHCPKCGFEIISADDFHYRVMIGEYAYFKCSGCNEITTEHVPYGVASPIMTPQYEEAMMEIKEMLEHSRCPKCGKTGTLSLWAPRLGCPKCKSKLITDGIPMCVD